MVTQGSKSAIVLIEFQKQWTEKGLYYYLIKRQMERWKVLENTIALVNQARSEGVRIIHAPLIIDPHNKKGWFAHLSFGKLFTKGSWKSAFTQGLYARGDLIIEGRYSFDAFIGSDLETVLKENKTESVFLCGFTTDQCVAKTMRTALAKGFKAYMVSDCTATFNAMIQRKTENRFQELVVNHLGVLSLIS